MSTFAVSSAANTTPVLVNKGPAFITGYHLTNVNAAARYLKLYDAAAIADVTVGTTLPKIIVPVLPGDANPGAATFGCSLHFNLGVVYSIVTGKTDADATAPSARDVVGALTYERA